MTETVTSTAPTGEPAIKVPAAAVVLGNVAHDTVRGWAAAGKIPAVKIGRDWFFYESQLRERDWLSRLPAVLSSSPVNVCRRQRDNERRSELRPKRAEYFAWHRASRAKRSPPWADRDAIRAIYTRAKRESDRLGVPHHVDHIIPLHGRLVSGLHVEANLRVIPGWANRHKSNR